jgi:hypothetical protein
MKYLLIAVVLCGMIACNNNEVKMQDVTINTNDSNIFSSPKELGESFFKSLQNLEDSDLYKHFVKVSDLEEVISMASPENNVNHFKGAIQKWSNIEADIKKYCNVLTDSIKLNFIELKNSKLMSVQYEIKEMIGWNGKLKNSEITILFDYQNVHYAISLANCGSINERWLIMTPVVKWVGRLN